MPSIPSHRLKREMRGTGDANEVDTCCQIGHRVTRISAEFPLVGVDGLN
jgi:hypothetical protein